MIYADSNKTTAETPAPSDDALGGGDYILLVRRGPVWCAVFKGPAEARCNAVGYDSIMPLPYPARLSESAVRATMQRLNPGVPIIGETE